MEGSIETVTVLVDARLVTLVGRRTSVRNIALKALARIAGEQLEILLCQVSTQYDVCLAVRPEIVGRVIHALRHEFDQHPVQNSLCFVTARDRNTNTGDDDVLT